MVYGLWFGVQYMVTIIRNVCNNLGLGLDDLRFQNMLENAGIQEEILYFN